MSHWIAVYCFVSAIMQFALGVAWRWHNPLHRAIKFVFLFASALGAFFGALVVKHIIQP